MHKFTMTLILILSLSLHVLAQPLRSTKPKKVGICSQHLDQVKTIITDAIEKEEIPGGVLLVTRNGKIILREAFGDCQWIPRKRIMKTDMMFDLASITKPVATATSIMILVEQGKIRLWDKVKDFIPQFSTYIDSCENNGEDARLWHLLTHTSGLPHFANAEEAKKLQQKYGHRCPQDSLMAYVARLKKIAPPGKEFRYSCIGYITLANIIEKVTGKTIAEFSEQHIFKPLNMKHTYFIPLKKFHAQCVPTEVIEGKPLIGVVHDPIARLLGGISGNAGLFSTADDLAIFAQMMIQKGIYKKTRILSPLTVERMTSIYPKVAFAGRGLGWDLNSDYSTNGGDLFGPNSFGHTGYTGTSLWIDPDTKTVVIFLTNRVHPNDEGAVMSLRSKVANIVASSIVKINN